MSLYNVIVLYFKKNKKLLKTDMVLIHLVPDSSAA